MYDKNNNNNNNNNDSINEDADNNKTYDPDDTFSHDMWVYNNQKYLESQINEVKVLLKRYIGIPETPAEERTAVKGSGVYQKREQKTPISFGQSERNSNKKNITDKYPPPALETICEIFSLSTFQKLLLVLCAGVELDTEFADLCAKVQGDPINRYATFGLALAVLPQPYWDALSPASNLRNFGLIEVSIFPQVPLTACPLRINEYILQFLLGNQYYQSQQLEEIYRLIGNSIVLDTKALPKSSKKIVNEIIQMKKNIAPTSSKEKAFVVQLSGSDDVSKLVIAWHISIAIRSISKQHFLQAHSPLRYLSAEQIPVKIDEVKSFANQLNHDLLLLASSVYISAERIMPATSTEASTTTAYQEIPINTQKLIMQLINRTSGLIFIGTDEPWPLFRQLGATFEVKRLSREEQLEFWRYLLVDNLDTISSPEQNIRESSQDIDLEISKIVNQFNFNMHNIITAVNQAKLLQSVSVSHSLPEKNPHDITNYLWESCRLLSRHNLRGLAQLIHTKKDMPDVVLPAHQRKILSNIAIHVVQRQKVYHEWGFEATTSRGLGITVLFSGPSGTGKTMAAELLSRNLGLDLFRIDLSAVVSKYIGETEKNLKRVFDAAEDIGAICFFDEADAIFGKRTEIQDSHDRFANIEISYLLQRMENYSGLAILATNMKSALDPAFMRRINFIVDFPFPSEDDRKRIWANIFPKNAQLARDIDFSRLAKLNITGGNIRNIALNASFLAADEHTHIKMEHIMVASQIEYAKLGKPVTQSEYGADWLAFLVKNTSTNNNNNDLTNTNNIHVS